MNTIKAIIAALGAGFIAAMAVVLGMKHGRKQGKKEGVKQAAKEVETADVKKQLKVIKKAKEIRDEIVKQSNDPNPDGVLVRVRDKYNKTRNNDS